MTDHDHWVTTRITEANKSHPLVTEAALARMDQLLKAQLIDRQLTPADLKSVATGLIEDMVRVRPKPEPMQ